MKIACFQCHLNDVLHDAFLKQLESVRSNLPLLYVLSFYLIIFMVSIFIIYLIILLFERTKYKIKEKLDF